MNSRSPVIFVHLRSSQVARVMVALRRSDGGLAIGHDDGLAMDQHLVAGLDGDAVIEFDMGGKVLEGVDHVERCTSHPRGSAEAKGFSISSCLLSFRKELRRTPPRCRGHRR